MRLPGSEVPRSLLYPPCSGASTKSVFAVAPQVLKPPPPQRTVTRIGQRARPERRRVQQSGCRIVSFHGPFRRIRVRRCSPLLFGVRRCCSVTRRNRPCRCRVSADRLSDFPKHRPNAHPENCSPPRRHAPSGVSTVSVSLRAAGIPLNRTSGARRRMHDVRY